MPYDMVGGIGHITWLNALQHSIPAVKSHANHPNRQSHARQYEQDQARALPAWPLRREDYKNNDEEQRGISRIEADKVHRRSRRASEQSKWPCKWRHRSRSIQVNRPRHEPDN